MDKDKHYINNVEIFAPGRTCHEATWNIDNGGKQNFAPYTHPVVGAVGLFINGRILVCGGAIQRYEECTGSAPRSCKRNRECVETDGGATWCTGPKTTECRAYKYIIISYLMYIFYISNKCLVTIMQNDISFFSLSVQEEMQEVGHGML